MKSGKLLIMSLKSHCVKNIVEMIKNLPPLLREEIIGESLKEIKKEAKKEVMKDIRRSAAVVVDDVTTLIIEAQRTGNDWKRPEYTTDIDDELYHTFVDISERFVSSHAEKLVFDEPSRPQTWCRTNLGNEWSDEDDEDY